MYVAKSSYVEIILSKWKNEIKLSFNQDWDGLLIMKLFEIEKYENPYEKKKTEVNLINFIFL